MPSLDNHDNEYGTRGSRFLSAGPTSSPRKSPSRQSLSINARRSTASLRGSSLSEALDDDAANGRHSLAHELAVALMPEPSAGSKLLAEEFGIEYDEGAEGIDENPERQNSVEGSPSTFHDELVSESAGEPGEQPSPTFTEDVPPDIDPVFGSPASPPKQRKQPEQDPMIILAQDLEYTERFLSQLRRLDSDPGAFAGQPNLEKLASDMIRRIDDTARDREGQVRELLGYEREFRKIAGELNGNDVLGQLDALENLIEEAPHEEAQQALDTLQEDPMSSSQLASEWDADADRDRLREDEDGYDSAYSPTPIKTTFPPPPPPKGPPTPANTISQLVHLRTFTTSTATSLAAISEHTQVNAAATTEAGRKIRALKNKLGGWRTEWDSAERSRLRIEKWEAGMDIELVSGAPPASPRSHSARRVDGRKIVQEHLQAFEKALTDANVKTQAIMASAS
ncbi:hypothetical protein AcW1_006402 [Taiwanofungus camphoratus]|nr:hypothetical protein AcW1_006402 [Antrodia cinnamomea]